MWDLIVYSNSTNSSVTYSLDSLAFVSLVGHDGLGMPPVENFSEQQAQQEGATFLRTRVKPRPIHLVFGAELDYAEDLWERRQSILRVMKPGLRLALRHTSEKGVVRQMDCYYSDGLPMPSSTKIGMLFKVGVTLMGFSPYWYDPNLVISIYEQNLVDDENPPVDIEHSYNGSADDYPMIFLENSLVTESVSEWANPYIYMFPSYTKIALNGYTIVDGGRVIINTAYSLKGITDENGNSLMAYLSDDSDLSSFRIQAADDGSPSRINTFLARSNYYEPGYAWSYKVTLRSFTRHLGI